MQVFCASQLKMLQVGVGLALEGRIPSCVDADERSFSQDQADTPKHILSLHVNAQMQR